MKDFLAQINWENSKVYLYPAAIVAGFYFLGLIIRGVVFKVLTKFAAKTRWEWDDIVIGGIKKPIMLWFVLFGVYTAIAVASVPEYVTDIVEKALPALLILSFTLVGVDIIGKLMAAYSAKLDKALPVTALTQNIVKLVIFTLGLLILLNTLGISITPLLTTLGIGGLAVALALQDTLSNLFAGFYTTVSKQIRVGDFIKLESGEEGYVADIGWRVTKVRMLPNNIVLIPNSKLSQAVITNYYQPEQELAVLVQVGVSYDSDLRKVEKITVEVGKEIMKSVKGGVPEFEPFIRYHTFNDFSIDFTVILRAKEFVDNYLIKHEFIKRLHERYNKEGIVIPFPIRTVQMEK